MQKALVSPQEVVEVLSEWLWDGKIWCAVYTQIPNSERIAQVETADKVFEVASPLYWIDCADTVAAGKYYYDSSTEEILPVPAPAPQPAV